MSAVLTEQTEVERLQAEVAEIRAEYQRLMDLEKKNSRIQLDILNLLDLIEAYELDLAKQHPAWLLTHARPRDEKTGEEFFFPDPTLPPDGAWETTDPDFPDGCWAESWRWQIDMMDWILENRQMIVLKARQIGASWVTLGVALWTMLFKPGSKIIAYRQTEKDVIETAQRVQQMWRSLPDHLKNGSIEKKPSKNALANTEFWLEFPDGRVSKFDGKPATASAAHGHTAAMILIDEGAYVELMAKIIAAGGPSIGKTGKIVVLSTANGVSDPETGEGNDFHHYWVNGNELRFSRRFFGWQMHPERDWEWFENDDEVRRLKPQDRAAQYPTNPDESFELTGSCYFDIDKLNEYGQKAVGKPLYRFQFKVDRDKDPRRAKKVYDPLAMIAVYKEPVPDTKYAISADSASGNAKDWSAGYVIDLSTSELVAEIRAKINPEDYTEQLHFLGKYYNTALLAPEVQGGYGTTIVTLLSSGHHGRPPYPNLYRHVKDTGPRLRDLPDWGYPMNKQSKRAALTELDDAINEGWLPYVTSKLLDEMKTYMPEVDGQTAKARPGCNDDCVIAAAIALDLYRQFGYHKRKQPRNQPRRPQALRPWNTNGESSNYEPRHYGPDRSEPSSTARRRARASLPFRSN